MLSLQKILDRTVTLRPRIPRLLCEGAGALMCAVSNDRAVTLLWMALRRRKCGASKKNVGESRHTWAANLAFTK